jgi:hypothetical protein
MENLVYFETEIFKNDLTTKNATKLRKGTVFLGHHHS